MNKWTPWVDYAVEGNPGHGEALHPEQKVDLLRLASLVLPTHQGVEGACA